VEGGLEIQVRLPKKPRASAVWWGLQLLIVILAISRYDATSFAFRGTDTVDFFNWFWRFRMAELFSFFDLALMSLLILTGARILLTGALPQSAFDGVLVAFAVLVALSTATRLVSQGPEDTAQDFLFQIRNYAYFCAAYFLASRVRWSDSRLRRMLMLVLGLAMLTIVLSIWESSSTPEELRVSKYGRFASVRDVSDFSIILFAQMWLIAILLERQSLRWWLRILVVLAIVYSLYDIFTGVGKATIFLVPMALLYFFWYYRLYRHPMYVLPVVALGAIVPLVFIYLAGNRFQVDESSPVFVYTTFSVDDPSVSTRSGEVINTITTLIERNALLQGIGLGARWYEYVQQPDDLGAYPQQEQGARWHLGVHVPLLRTALDFGFVGLLVLFTVFFMCYSRTLRMLRYGGLGAVTNAFVQAAWLVVIYELLVNNLSVPKPNLLAGFLLGAVSGLVDANRRRLFASGGEVGGGVAASPPGPSALVERRQSAERG
jgi:hypothetical protein